MTLTARLVLAVALALAAVTTVTLLSADAILARRADEPLERQVEARLAWLRSCIEPGKGEVEWREMGDDPHLAPIWSLTTAGGTVLHQSGKAGADVVGRSQRVVIGRANGPAAADSELRQHDDEFRLANRSRHLELVLSAHVDASAAHADLARQRWLLWSLGPALALCLLGLLATVIHWQVRPLARMVARIAAIDATDTGQRLGAVGGAAECRRLAVAVDAMLARIAGAREHERAFSAAAAHELRTPLAQLALALEVAARRDRGPAETRQLLADLRTDVERLQDLALGLLQLASTSAIHVTSLPLAPLLRELGEVALPPVDPALEVHGNAALLAVVLGNLVGNAHRYAPGAPPEIGVAHERDIVEVTVADRGPGVPVAERERIFAPLVRLDAARSIGAQANGFGLGLAIARTLARRMGGDLTCTARPDGQTGACFVLRLLSGSSAAASPAPSTAPAAPPG